MAKTSSPTYKKLSKKIINAELLMYEQNNLDFSSDEQFVRSLSTSSNISEPLKRLLPDLAFVKSVPRAVVVEDNIVIDIRNGQIVLDEAATEWLQELSGHENTINRLITSVGKIEWGNHPVYPSPTFYIGTGFLLEGSNYVLTNRHVVSSFAEKKPNGRYDFKILGRHRIRPRIDFIEEYDERLVRELHVEIAEIVAVSENPKLDLALLRLAATNTHLLPSGLKLSSLSYPADKKVIAVGYPNNNNTNISNYHREVRNRLFRYYKFKTVSPGALIDRPILPADVDIVDKDWSYLHNCSVLKGNSGSPLIDFTNGSVIGLHCGGAYFEYNYAIKSTRIIEFIKPFIS